MNYFKVGDPCRFHQDLTSDVPLVVEKVRWVGRHYQYVDVSTPRIIKSLRTTKGPLAIFLQRFTHKGQINKRRKLAQRVSTRYLCHLTQQLEGV